MQLVDVSVQAADVSAAATGWTSATPLSAIQHTASCKPRRHNNYRLTGMYSHITFTASRSHHIAYLSATRWPENKGRKRERATEQRPRGGREITHHPARGSH